MLIATITLAAALHTAEPLPAKTFEPPVAMVVEKRGFFRRITREIRRSRADQRARNRLRSRGNWCRTGPSPKK